EVAARTRPAAGGREADSRVGAELVPVVVERPQLRQVAVRLLEVVAEDLLVLARAVAVDAVGPADELLVQRRARALEQSLVGRVPDEHVVEAPRILEAALGGLGPHELLAAERVEVGR